MAALAPTKGSFLHALQLENDALRRKLRRAHEDMERLLQQPQRESKGCRGTAEGGSRGSRHEGGGNAGHVERLERRCELLATRLVAIVRDRQLSECSEIQFLLRTQEEERRFLHDALVTLLEKQKVSAGDDEYRAQTEKEVSPVMLSALIMRLAENMQSSHSQSKLEQTERIMLLGQTTDIILDIQKAIERAARWVYGYHCDFLHEGFLQEPTLWREAHNSGIGRLRSLADVTPDVPPRTSFRKRSSNHSERRWREEVDCSIEFPLSSVHQTEAAADLSSRRGDLLEACDVLRACHQALTGVRTLLGEAMSNVTSSRSSQTGKPTNVEELLKGFHRDLQEMVRSNERCRETLARRLEAEIEAHRRTVQMYEARLKLAERELIDHLTSSHTFQKPLGSNDAEAPSFSNYLGKEVNAYHGDTGATTPPTPTGKTATGNLHTVRGNDNIQRQFAPGKTVPLSPRRDLPFVSEGHNDKKQKRREYTRSDIPHNGSVCDVASFLFPSSPSVAAVSGPLPETRGRQREDVQSFSSRDTLDDRTCSNSTGEGSVTHSPPPLSASRRERHPSSGKIQEGRVVVSSQRCVRWPRGAVLLSPSAF
ncbi:hypothetical protein MOQ_001410 [Trypanosoma cruzi marinkellei]|uniref:Uncharacterized protein n=1 Tax=Trypanosoma cruzi marinkellei TaxID=85056 RepID=K2NGA9_TRYCR|nr:hypothetical protein MOQ_001410 [Trypanosoma cruzi marinkellei]